MKITIFRAISIFGGITAVAFCVVLATSFYALGELKVGGPLYAKIKLGNDLVADILPPPAYVIEAYLEATLALQEPPKATASHREKLARLRREYNDRYAFWTASDLIPDLKAKLLVASHGQVEAFFSAVETQLLPAVARGDRDATNKAYTAVQNAYAAHRKVIDDIVAGATAVNEANEATAARDTARLQAIMWSVAGFVMLILVGGVVGILIGIVKPIGRMTHAMTVLAGGRTETAIPALGRRDEIGAMADAVQVFRDGMVRNIELEATAEQTRIEVEADRRRMMTSLADQFDEAIGNTVNQLSQSSRGMEATARQMKVHADQTSAQSQSVSAAALTAATSVTCVAGSAEELGTSIAEISRRVERSSQMSRIAVTEIEAAARTITELSETTARIDSIVEMISTIASQTNLLALNATIEAARAGEAGRGFTVVASEVKNLATQTATATTEIARQLAAIQTSTGTVVTAIDGVAGTMRDIHSEASSITAIVEQQGAATHEIATAVTQAASGTNTVTENIIIVADAAAQAGTASQAMLSACSNLADNTDVLRQQVQTFLSNVRAA